MKTPASLLCVLGLFLADGPALRAQAPAPAPAGDAPVAGTAALPPGAQPGGWFNWPVLGGAVPSPDVPRPERKFTHWFIPVDLYVRSGILLESGKGALSESLQPGFDFEFGGRQYFFTGADHLSAWTADLGMVFLYNKASKLPVLTADGVPDILDMMYRIYVKVGGGYEWYYTGNDLPDSWRYVFGVEGAGMVGHAHAHFKAAPLANPDPTTGGLTPGDTPIFILNATDTPVALGGGFHVGVVIPRPDYELHVGFRADYLHEWIKIFDGDKALDEFRLSVYLNWRY
jgi:hypothetical protein